MNAQEWEQESNRILTLLAPHVTNRQLEHVNAFIDEVKGELVKQPVNGTWKELATQFHLMFAREANPRFRTTNTLPVVHQFIGFVDRWVPPSDLTIESAPNRLTHRFEVEVEAELLGHQTPPTKQQVENLTLSKLKHHIGPTDVRFVNVKVL